MSQTPVALPRLPVPEGFLWGASTSAHQVEGGNTNSNWWHLEQSPESPLPEASGNALDHYNRYPEDMRLLAEAGLTAYRFSIEWARIEPSPGEFSAAELEHYRRMIDTALALGLTPVVTLHHFTSPLWFTQRGGWRGAGAADAYAGYVEVVSTILQDVPWVCTINEPNMIALSANLFTSNASTSAATKTDERAISAYALPEPADDVAKILTEAHRRATEILHRRTDARIGWTVSIQGFEATEGHEDVLRRLQWAWEDRFLEVSREDDFVGVQSYTTRSVGKDGVLPYAEDPGNTMTGWPNRPDALGTAIRRAWEVAEQTPILVTENGIATADDSRRIVYIEKALQGLGDAVADGIDVRGYLHWSALDAYEWGDWTPLFGLIAVDRSTFVRTPRPSLAWFGNTARSHAEPRVLTSATTEKG